MQTALDSMVRWFRQAAVPDYVWLRPGDFLSEARVRWDPAVAEWLYARETDLIALTAAAVQAASAGQAHLGRRLRLEDLSALQRDAMARPIPPSWLDKLQQACVGGADECVFTAARTVLSAMEAQKASPGLAARALNYVMRADASGKVWLPLFEPRGLEKLSTPEQVSASRACRLMDLLACWWEQDLQSAQLVAADAGATEAASPDSAETPVPSDWLTLKQAAQLLGQDERGQPLVSVSSLRKEFLAGRIQGMRARNSCNGRILLSRTGIDKWAHQTAAARQVVLSPAEAHSATRRANPAPIKGRKRAGR